MSFLTFSAFFAVCSCFHFPTNNFLAHKPNQFPITLSNLKEPNRSSLHLNCFHLHGINLIEEQVGLKFLTQVFHSLEKKIHSRKSKKINKTSEFIEKSSLCHKYFGLISIQNIFNKTKLQSCRYTWAVIIEKFHEICGSPWKSPFVSLSKCIDQQ